MTEMYSYTLDVKCEIQDSLEFSGAKYMPEVVMENCMCC